MPQEEKEPAVLAVATALKFLSKEAILKTQDVKFDTVHVPEWGGHVRIMSMTGEDAATLGDGPKAEGIVRIVAMSVVDENGNRLFTIEDVRELAKKNFRALSRIQEVAARLNGLDKALQEALRKI